MPQLIFINLPVADLARSIAFYKAVGATRNPMFSDDTAACMVVSDVILPVGISFFTFQGMSYVIDVFNGRTRPARLLDLTVLMSFFPHLVAGPIVRPSHLLPQLRQLSCCFSS